MKETIYYKVIDADTRYGVNYLMNNDKWPPVVALYKSLDEYISKNKLFHYFPRYLPNCNYSKIVNTPGYFVFTEEKYAYQFIRDEYLPDQAIVIRVSSHEELLILQHPISSTGN